MPHPVDWLHSRACHADNACSKAPGWQFPSTEYPKGRCGIPLKKFESVFGLRSGGSPYAAPLNDAQSTAAILAWIAYPAYLEREANRWERRQRRRVAV